jgi:hypothetical protein
MIIPLSLGRSSYVLPAKQLDVPVSEVLKCTLTQSYLQSMATAGGRYGCHKFLVSGVKYAWMDSHRLFVQNNMKMFTTVKNVQEEHFYALITSMSNETVTLAYKALDIILILAHQRVSNSHPMSSYYNSLLGTQGMYISQAQGNNDLERYITILQSIQSALCTRLGITAEEIYAIGSENGLHLHDCESFLKQSNELVNAESTVTASSGAAKLLMHALGCVDASMLVKIFLRSPSLSSTMVGASTSSSTFTAEVLKACSSGKLRRMLIQQSVSSVLQVHERALTGMTTVAGRHYNLYCIFWHNQ